MDKADAALATVATEMGEGPRRIMERGRLRAARPLRAPVAMERSHEFAHTDLFQRLQVDQQRAIVLRRRAALP